MRGVGEREREREPGEDSGRWETERRELGRTVIKEWEEERGDFCMRVS